MFAARRAREAPFLSRDQLVLAPQACRAVASDLMALIDEAAVHAGAAISAVQQREGRADMRRIGHVLPLAATGSPFLLGKEAALADPENTTHPADREAGLLRFDEAEGHPWRLPSNQWRSAAKSIFREESRGFFD